MVPQQWSKGNGPEQKSRSLAAGRHDIKAARSMYGEPVPELSYVGLAV
jgi:hypothetical protein